MQNYLSFLTNKKSKDISNTAVDFFDKLPHLPERWREVIVKILPYLALFGGVTSLISAVQNLLNPHRFNRWVAYFTGISPIYFYITAVISAILAILYLQAYPMLKERKIEGWLLIFWGAILGLIQNLLAIIFAWGGIAGTLFWGFVGFYLIYEIRPAYLGKKIANKKDSSKTKTKKSKTNKKK